MIELVAIILSHGFLLAIIVRAARLAREEESDASDAAASAAKSKK
jgi:hypothetical protein